VLLFDELVSTNAFAAELAGDPANAGVCVLAAAQTAGRGQHGRSWVAPPDSGVLLSILLFPPSPIRRPVLLTAWAAVAVAETVRLAAGVQTTIKWPNDVMIAGRKVCGILIEQGAGTVAGIGLNVRQSAADFEAAGLPEATSLSLAAGRPIDTHAVARLLIERLDAEYDGLMRGDVASLESAWQWRVGLLGRPVVAELVAGGTASGRLRELAFSGVELEQTDGTPVRLTPEAIRHLRER
jgi:BirA family transcriptional regulator, biotin operon repressor / biotin---[acetyl-CoA-carboxylase] ligase